MATDQSTVAMNGYAGQGQGFDANYAAHAANSASTSGGYGATPPQASTTSSNANGAAEIPKDEVGWYFVEQYYTTLSRSPEKLFLFYNKRSQFVSGVEEEKVSVCVGQKAINDRIKDLDFQDCKVRVTNVDSQGSDTNIVIQVIGEISNKSAPHRKFAQTFVLAGQTNGYFVLNDIFRYIQEEEEVVEEELPQETDPVPAGYVEPAPTAIEHEDQAGAHETVVAPEDVEQVDKELEAIEKDEKKEVSPPPGQVNGTPVPEKAEVVEAEEAPAAAVDGAEEAPTKEAPTTEAVEPAAEEEIAQPEKPQDPAPTPAPAPKASPAPPAAPAAPAKPAVPMSWAMKAASAHRAAPPAPAAASQAPSQPKAAAPAQSKPAAAAPSAPAAASTTGSASPAENSQDGWQTAGAEHNKRQSRAQNQPILDAPTGFRAYIKNVFEHTDPEVLKAELGKFDTIKYFDINRPKNAAFVEFATQEGFQAAVAANPHQIGQDSIIVEERRQPSGNFRGGYAGGRGGSIGGRGRGGAEGRPQGRGGFNKDGGRGGFAPRGRGNNAPRRGGATAA